MLHTQSFSINSPLTDRDNLITISFLTKWKNLDFSLQTEVSRFLAIHGLFRYFHPYSFFRTRFVAEKQRSASPFLPRIELSSIAIDINLLESKWMEISKHHIFIDQARLCLCSHLDSIRIFSFWNCHVFFSQGILESSRISKTL